jgi:hypothetical protein
LTDQQQRNRQRQHEGRQHAVQVGPVSHAAGHRGEPGDEQGDDGRR